MSYSIIAAIGKNNELGKNNNLIWHLKGDLKFFKEKTTDHVIVMGRKTFESLPKLLPNRHHVVLTSKKDLDEEVEVFNNINDFMNAYKDYKEEIFIIGGSSIYKSFIEYSDKLYLTEIDKEDKTADVYFPYFDKKNYDREVLGGNEENGIKYEHVLYRRLKK